MVEGGKAKHSQNQENDKLGSVAAGLQCETVNPELIPLLVVVVVVLGSLSQPHGLLRSRTIHRIDR